MTLSLEYVAQNEKTPAPHAPRQSGSMRSMWRRSFYVEHPEWHPKTACSTCSRCAAPFRRHVDYVEHVECSVAQNLDRSTCSTCSAANKHSYWMSIVIPSLVTPILHLIVPDYNALFRHVPNHILHRIRVLSWGALITQGIQMERRNVGGTMVDIMLDTVLPRGCIINLGHRNRLNCRAEDGFQPERMFVLS